MKTLGKFLGLLLLGLLLIAVALGFALSHLFDPNDYKEDIRKLARDKAGLDLQLQGQIGWTLFPRLGLQLGDVSLASTQSSDRPFARIGQLGLSVRLLPLLSGNIDMNAVRIDSLQLDLQRDAQGHGNWELGQATASTGNDHGSQTNGGQHDRLQHIDIATLELTRSRIRYTDVASGQVLTLNELNLTTGAIREGSNIALELTSQLSASQPQLAGHLRLTGQLRAEIDQRRYQLQDLDLSGSLNSERAGSSPLEYSVRGQLLADLAAGNAEWRNLAIKANQLELSGELRARQLDQASPVLEGQLAAAPVNLRAMMSAIGLPLPEVRDPATFKRVGFNTRLTASASQLALEELQLQLDDSHLTGKLLGNLADKGQQLSLQLQGDQLEIDRYLPIEQAASTDTGSSTPATASTGWSDTPLLPLDSLRKLTADISLDLQKLTVQQLPLQDFALRLKAAGGQIQLDQLQGSVDGGKLLLKGSLDARSDKPRLQLQGNMDRLPLEPLLQAANPQQPAPLHGILQLETSLSAQGNSSRDLIASLDGKTSFAITEGALIGVNLEQQMCQGIALVNRQSLSREFPADTALQELRGSLLIDNGVISNNDLSARIPGLNLAGKGSVDLNKRSLDYRAGLTLVGAQGADADPACKVSDKLASLSWPLRCSGALADGGKTCSIDREAVAATAVKAAGGKLRDKLTEKVGSKVQDKLKSLQR